MSRLPGVQAVTKQEQSVPLNTSRSLCPLAWRRLEILERCILAGAGAGEGAEAGAALVPAPASASTLLCLGAKIEVEVKEGVSPLDEFKTHYHTCS